MIEVGLLSQLPKAIYRGEGTPFTTSRGPPCMGDAKYINMEDVFASTIFKHDWSN